MRNIIKATLLGVACVVIASCSGGGGGASSGGSSATPILPIPTPTVVPDVNLGNISTIPLNGNSSNTSIVVTNNLSTGLVLQSATYTIYTGDSPTALSVSTIGSPVNVSLCTSVAAHGTCSVGVRAPITHGHGEYLLSMNYLDPTTAKVHKISQIISYSDSLPTSSTGAIYSTMNTALHNNPNGSTSLSIPFVLTKSFTNISASSDRNNPAVTPTISCEGGSFVTNSMCTLHVTVSNTGNSDVVSCGITVFADQLSQNASLSIMHSMLNPSSMSLNSLGMLQGIVGMGNTIQGATGYLFGVPLTITQNTTGNMVTSGINVTINPSDGLVANAQTITLLNNGTATITGISITGITPVVISSNTCTSLAANASCTFKVNVTSLVSGQSSAIVTYNNGASSGNTLGSVSFNVIYISPVASPASTMTSGQGNLLNVAINTIQYYSIKVNNTGNVKLESIIFSDPSTAGTGGGVAFSWDTTSTCATNGTQALIAGGSCTLVLKYAPTIVTSVSTITIRQNAIWYDQANNPQTYANANLGISYSAINGDAFVYITPNYVSFAIRADGIDTVSQTFTVQNSGLQSTTLNTITIPSVTAFTRTGGTCTAGSTVLAVNATCTIIVIYGTTTTTATNVAAQITVGYKPNLNYASNITTFTNLVFNASTAAYITVSNIVVTNASSGNGLLATPYQFTSSPVANTQIDFVVTYSNTGPAAATNFNVALNNLPVGYVVVVGDNTTCGYGLTVTTVAATSGTCKVEFKAVDSAGLYNSYALYGALNINIPGYSYNDTNTGLNTMQFPTWTGNYANGNTIYVNANLLAAITTTPPTWLTADAGGTNNYTFSGTPNGTIITIPATQLVGSTITFGAGRTCTISSGTCTIAITNIAGTPLGTNYFSYIVSPTGQAPNGIVQQANFIFSSAPPPLTTYALLPSGSVATVGEYTLNSATGALTFNNLTTVTTSFRKLYATANNLFGYGVFINSANIPMYSISSVGKLAALSTPIIAGNNGPNQQDGAFSQDGNFFYVSSSSVPLISQFGVNKTTGLLTALSPSYVAGSGGARLLSHPTLNVLYALSAADQRVYWYTINTSTGQLSVANYLSTTGVPQALIIDSTGTYLYVLDYPDTKINMFRIDPSTGYLTPLDTPWITSATSNGFAALSPNGKFIYSVSGNSDQMAIYSINQSTGMLTQQGSTINQPCNGNNGKGLTFDPSGTWLYQPCYANNSVNQYTWNTTTGELSLVTNYATTTIGALYITFIKR